MNMNDVAREITLLESGEKEISIAQVKEVLKLFLEYLASLEPLELFTLLKRYE